MTAKWEASNTHFDMENKNTLYLYLKWAHGNDAVKKKYFHKYKNNS